MTGKLTWVLAFAVVGFAAIGALQIWIAWRFAKIQRDADRAFLEVYERHAAAGGHSATTRERSGSEA